MCGCVQDRRTCFQVSSSREWHKEHVMWGKVLDQKIAVCGHYPYIDYIEI
jgi:hypothetical protein